MSKVLFVCSTVDGHTLEICERLQGVIETEGHSAAIEILKPSSAIDASEFDAVVIGASIRYGKHRREVTLANRRKGSRLPILTLRSFSIQFPGNQKQ
jgi:menaquinone-dependent protoporphyrinogen oxidase